MLRIRGSYFQGIMLANESLFSNLFAIHMLQQKNHVISDLFFLCALSFGCKRACPWYFFFILLSLFFVFLVSYLLIICYYEKLCHFRFVFCLHYHLVARELALGIFFHLVQLVFCVSCFLFTNHMLLRKIMSFQICFLSALSFGCKRACPWYFFSSC